MRYAKASILLFLTLIVVSPLAITAEAEPCIPVYIGDKPVPGAVQSDGLYIAVGNYSNATCLPLDVLLSPPVAPEQHVRYASFGDRLLVTVLNTGEEGGLFDISFLGEEVSKYLKPGEAESISFYLPTLENGTATLDVNGTEYVVVTSNGSVSAVTVEAINLWLAGRCDDLNKLISSNKILQESRYSRLRKCPPKYIGRIQLMVMDDEVDLLLTIPDADGYPLLDNRSAILSLVSVEKGRIRYLVRGVGRAFLGHLVVDGKWGREIIPLPTIEVVPPSTVASSVTVLVFVAVSVAILFSFLKYRRRQRSIAKVGQATLDRAADLISKGKFTEAVRILSDVVLGKARERFGALDSKILQAKLFQVDPNWSYAIKYCSIVAEGGKVGEAEARLVYSVAARLLGLSQQGGDADEWWV